MNQDGDRISLPNFKPNKTKKAKKKNNDSSRIFFWATKYKRVKWLELNLNSEKC